MKLLKRLGVTFGSLILTTGLLFTIGHLFSIPILMFHYEYTNDESGFFISGGSLLPLVISLVVSYFAEKFYVYKHQQKLG
ncbi:hypothetical protein [Bacillus sp. S14(2024)]|uniref:hypothetical protein n=1 Tax=Bacillus sp. S14(2024) TaxID=3162884 RepID=UPI003D25C261